MPKTISRAMPTVPDTGQQQHPQAWDQLLDKASPSSQSANNSCPSSIVTTPSDPYWGVERQRKSHLSNFVLAGLSSICVTVITNPLDVIKTQQQLSGELSSHGPGADESLTRAYRNMFRSARHIRRRDGLFGLQRGLGAAVAFQVTLNSLRLGIFDTSIALGLNRPTSVWESFFWGSVGGIAGAVVASPFHLVKSQMQAVLLANHAVGFQQQQPGFWQVLRRIRAEAQMRRVLYRSVYVTIPKAAMSSGAQLASYAPAREYIRQHELLSVYPTVAPSVLCGLFAGSVMAVTMTPPDTVLTRLANQPVDSRGRGLYYAGALDCARQIVRLEGLGGLYKGFWPNQLRVAINTTMLLAFYDWLKQTTAI